MLTSKDFYTARTQSIEARLPLDKAEEAKWKKVCALWDRYMEEGMKEEDFKAHQEAWAQWSILHSWKQALWRQSMVLADMAHAAWDSEMEALKREIGLKY